MASGLAARNGGRLGIAALVAILLLGLGLRLGEAWDGRAPVYDAQAYAAIAANLEGGEGFTLGAGDALGVDAAALGDGGDHRATQPASNYSPGLPLLVAGLYEATGGVHERLGRVVLALIGTLSVLFAYLLGRRLGRAPHRPQAPEVVPVPEAPLVKNPQRRAENSPRVWTALAGALVVAIYPALLEYQGMLMSEPLAATLISGGVLAMLWAWEGGWVRWLLPGALFGALALTRPEYLGVIVLLAAVVALRPASPRATAAEAGRPPRRWHSLTAAGVMLAAAFVVIAPWTIRNAVALDRFVPISTGGGQVLFAGTYLPSDGDPEKVGEGVVAENPGLFSPRAARQLRLEQILARLAADRYPGMESDQALSKLGKEQLWDDVSEEPVEYTGFVAAKAGRIWSHGPRDVMREPGWEVLHWLLVAFGLLGLAILAWRRRWEALLFGAIFLAITAISALLVASPRRVLVLVPLLAALTTVSLTWAQARLASSHRHGDVDSPIAGSPRRDSLGRP